MSRGDSSAKAKLSSEKRSFLEYLNAPGGGRPVWVDMIAIGVFLLAGGMAILFAVLLGILGDIGSARLTLGITLMSLGVVLILAGSFVRRGRLRLTDVEERKTSLGPRQDHSK